MNNPHIRSADSLTTTPDARRSGFLEYALRRNREAIPFIDKGKALKAILQSRTKTFSDIPRVSQIKDTLLEAAGVSVKAKAHLSDKDKKKVLTEFIEKVLKPCGSSYVDEIVYRYLLTAGDALGGKMRNIVGSIANEKLTRFIVSQLQVCKIKFEYASSRGGFIESEKYSIEISGDIKAIRWNKGKSRASSLVYNVNVPIVGKNIDIVLLSRRIDCVRGAELTEILSDTNNYKMIGELKGGIDPAGADEHWKTANTALARVRKAFKGKLPLVFIGAAIESAMAMEIFAQYKSGELSNCANLTSDDQLASLCEWLVRL